MNTVQYANLPITANAGDKINVYNTWSVSGVTEFTFDGIWKPTPGQTILEIDYKLAEPIMTLTVSKTWAEIIQAETGTLPPDWLSNPAIKLNVSWTSSLNWGIGNVFGDGGVTCGGPCAFAGVGGSPTGTVLLWKLKIYS